MESFEIPPPSVYFPEAEEDKRKYERLRKNVRMMEFEHEKLSKQAQCKVDQNISSGLNMARLCLENAYKTFNEYHNFLKEHKYKSWNQGKLNSEENINNCFDDFYVQPNEPDQENGSFGIDAIPYISTTGKFSSTGKFHRKKERYAAKRHRQNPTQLKCQLDSGTQKSPNYDCPRNRVYHSWYQILPHIFYTHMESLYNSAVKTGQIFLTCPHNKDGAKCALNYFTKAKYCSDKPFDEQLAIRLFALSKHIEKVHTGEERMSECPECSLPILGRYLGDQEGWQLVQFWSHLCTHLDEYKNHPPGAVMAVPARMFGYGCLRCVHGCEFTMFDSSYDYITHILSFHWSFISEQSISSGSVYLSCPAKDGCRFEVRRRIFQNLEVEGGIALTEMFDHLRKWHTEDEMAPDHCPRCFMDTQFMQDSQFWQHLAQHSDIETYFCESCQVFVARKQRDYHLQECSHPGVGFYIQNENARKLEVKKQLKELGVVKPISSFGVFAKQIQQGKDLKMKELEQTNTKKANKLKAKREKKALIIEKKALRMELISKISNKDKTSKKEQKKLNKEIKDLSKQEKRKLKNKLKHLERETNAALKSKPTDDSTNGVEGVEGVNVDISVLSNLLPTTTGKESSECNSTVVNTNDVEGVNVDISALSNLLPTTTGKESSECNSNNLSFEIETSDKRESGPNTGIELPMAVENITNNLSNESASNLNFNCKWCDKEIDKRIHLQHQLQCDKRQNVDQPEMCKLCEQLANNFVDHQLTCPGMIKQTCSKCGYVNFSFLFKDHEEKCKGEIREKVTCDVCKCIVYKINLDKHERRCKGKTCPCGYKTNEGNHVLKKMFNHLISCEPFLRLPLKEKQKIPRKAITIAEVYVKIDDVTHLITTTSLTSGKSRYVASCFINGKLVKVEDSKDPIDLLLKFKKIVAKAENKKVSINGLNGKQIRNKLKNCKGDRRRLKRRLLHKLGKPPATATSEEMVGKVVNQIRREDRNMDYFKKQRLLNKSAKLAATTFEEMDGKLSNQTCNPEDSANLPAPKASKNSCLGGYKQFFSQLEEKRLYLEHAEKLKERGVYSEHAENFPNVDADNQIGHVDTHTIPVIDITEPVQKDCRKKIQVNLLAHSIPNSEVPRHSIPNPEVPRHSIPNPDVPRFTCDHCGTYFSQERILNFHMAMHIQRRTAASYM